jgi:lipid II:glycine glycyltransferase (peptidoglycan interpeptide bridge formation enzyme)
VELGIQEIQVILAIREVSVQAQAQVLVEAVEFVRVQLFLPQEGFMALQVGMLYQELMALNYPPLIRVMEDHLELQVVLFPAQQINQYLVV